MLFTAVKQCAGGGNLRRLMIYTPLLLLEFVFNHRPLRRWLFLYITCNNDSHNPFCHISANALEWHEVCGVNGEDRSDLEVNFGCVDDNYDGNRGEND